MNRKEQDELIRALVVDAFSFTNRASGAAYVVQNLRANGLLVTPKGEKATDYPVKPCYYLSSACHHERKDGIKELHADCRDSCKHCGTQCVCRNHEGNKNSVEGLIVVEKAEGSQ